MDTKFAVRMLLVLWASEGGALRQGGLNGRFSGRTAEANQTREGLIAAGAIEASADGKLFTLTDAGKVMLTEAMAGDEFWFEAQIGAKMANDLLKWFRSQPKSLPVVKAVGNAIESYEAFKVVVLEVYDRLNRDFNLDNLVPIYRIRREIGNRVSRSEFDEWLLDMQADDIVQLQGGSLPDGNQKNLEDSITTELSGLRCYMTLL